MMIDEIGSAIRARRVSLRLSQQEVAELAGVARSLVVALESASGPRGVTLSKMLAVCEVVGLDVLVRPRRTGAERSDG